MGLDYGESKETTLTVDAVCAAAVARTGLDDFGPDDFTERLGVQLGEMDADEDRTGLGRLLMFGDSVRYAANRLLVRDLLRRHPEILEIPIEPPAHRDRPAALGHHPPGEPVGGRQPLPLDAVVGVLRAGAPPRGGVRLGTTGWIPDGPVASSAWEAMQAAAPLVAAMHPMEPDHVHEEIELQLPDFSSYNLEWVARAPQWRDYYLAHDQTPHYAYMKTVLQILQWYRPRERWVLKSPQHLEQLGPLLATFPDATIVVTHRDPVAVVQSTITMACYGARTAYRTPRPEWYRDYWTDRIGLLLDALVARPAPPARRRTVDVLFDEYMADEMGTLERVYELRRHGAHRRRPGPRSPPTGTPIPRGKEGRVVYDLRRDFSITPDEVRARFGAYLDRFPVRIEVAMKTHRGAGGPPDRHPPGQGAPPRPSTTTRPTRSPRAIYRSGGSTAAYLLAHRQRAGHRQHGHGLRGAAPQARLRRRPARPDALHRHHPGPRRPSSAASTCSRRPDTVYVAQANNQACQADDARIRGLRMRTAGIWFDTLGTDARRIAKENPGVSMRQSEPVPDVTLDDRLELTCDGLRHRAHGGRGGDDRQPDRVAAGAAHRARSATCSVPLFPHFPNLNTLRGDRYRFVEPYLESVRKVRALRPEVLVTGRHEPIVGADLIDASLARLSRRGRLRAPAGPRGLQRRDRRVDADARDRAPAASCGWARATARCPGRCAPCGRPTWAGSSCSRPPSSIPTRPGRRSPTSLGALGPDAALDAGRGRPGPGRRDGGHPDRRGARRPRSPAAAAARSVHGPGAHALARARRGCQLLGERLAARPARTLGE